MVVFLEQDFDLLQLLYANDLDSSFADAADFGNGCLSRKTCGVQ
jgi:hypothetical protein